MTKISHALRGQVDQLEDRYLGMVEAASSNLALSTRNFNEMLNLLETEISNKVVTVVKQVNIASNRFKVNERQKSFRNDKQSVS